MPSRFQCCVYFSQLFLLCRLSLSEHLSNGISRQAHQTNRWRQCISTATSDIQTSSIRVRSLGNNNKAIYIIRIQFPKVDAVQRILCNSSELHAPGNKIAIVFFHTAVQHRNQHFSLCFLHLFIVRWFNQLFQFHLNEWALCICIVFCWIRMIDIWTEILMKIDSFQFLLNNAIWERGALHQHIHLFH